MSRAAGILMPITSLPSPYGIGTIGKEAREFADFLKASGQKIWQILLSVMLEHMGKYLDFRICLLLYHNYIIVDVAHNLFDYAEIFVLFFICQKSVGNISF